MPADSPDPVQAARDCRTALYARADVGPRVITITAAKDPDDAAAPRGVLVVYDVAASPPEVEAIRREAQKAAAGVAVYLTADTPPRPLGAAPGG